MLTPTEEERKRCVAFRGVYEITEETPKNVSTERFNQIRHEQWVHHVNSFGKKFLTERERKLCIQEFLTGNRANH